MLRNVKNKERKKNHCFLNEVLSLNAQEYQSPVGIMAALIPQ